MLSTGERATTAAWIASQQSATGEIAWWRGGKFDPWDHVHAAMGLSVAGRFAEAARAYRFLVDTQLDDGAWAAERRSGVVSDATRDTNHAAYFATGVGHHFRASQDRAFLDAMWPSLERAIGFVLAHQDDAGWIAWAVSPEGVPWKAPLLTGCSSIHGSLVSALQIAAELGRDRPVWEAARQRLADVLQGDLAAFESTDLPEGPGRYSMDWYYPILGGALRDQAARERLLEGSVVEDFVTPGAGCRCVRDQPWYTVAESSELVLALDACGLRRRAQLVASWVAGLRDPIGSYATGRTYPEDVVWPEERNTWTAAAVLIADDALSGRSRTSSFFRDLVADPPADAAIAS